MTNSQKRRARKEQRVKDRAAEVERMQEMAENHKVKFFPHGPTPTGCTKRRNRRPLTATGQRARRGYLI